MRLELVAALRPERVLVKDVLVRRIHHRWLDLRDFGQRLRIVGSVLAPLRRPGGQMRQLGEQNGGLERVQAGVGADFLMVVLLGTTMQAQLLESLCGGVVRGY